MSTVCGRPQGGRGSGPCGRMWTEGRWGVKNVIFVDVINEWPLTSIVTNAHFLLLNNYCKLLEQHSQKHVFEVCIFFILLWDFSLALLLFEQRILFDVCRLSSLRLYWEWVTFGNTRRYQPWRRIISTRSAHIIVNHDIWSNCCFTADIFCCPNIVGLADRRRL